MASGDHSADQGQDQKRHSVPRSHARPLWLKPMADVPGGS
jgi:hypothetical protein